VLWFAAALLPLLLYLPGRVISRVFAGALPADPIERHAERLLVGALLNGWLALLLASLGLFSLWLHLLLLGLACAGALAWRYRFGRGIALPVPLDRPVGRLEIAAYAASFLLALLLVSRPFEVILGARDAGVYATSGMAMARTGALVQHDDIVADMGRAAQSDDPALRGPAEQGISNFLGVQDRSRYIATRLRAAGYLINEGEAAEGRIVPQFLHLFPAWIGLLSAIGGPYAGLFAPGLLGSLGVLSVGLLGRRLAGPWVGLLAMLFLALNGVQVWFSRYSTAETSAQFLTFAGLYFFARFAAANPEPRANASPYYGLLAGVAAGQVVLARIDAFLIIPLGLFLLYSGVSRRWTHGHTFMAAGLAAMLLHAGLHILFIARAYVLDTGFDRLQDYVLISLLVLPFLTPEVADAYLNGPLSPFANPMKIWRELAALGAGLVVLLLLWRRPGWSRRLETLLRRARRPLLALTAGGIVLLAGYAYFLRPQIIDADILFNTRGGWNDPLERDPRLVQQDVNEWRMPAVTAREQAGVVLEGPAYWAATKIDVAATEALREQLRAERGPWQGPFSNQTFNWMRLQGYVGAPIALPRIVYDADTSWWQEFTEVPAGVEPPPGIPVKDKYAIPLANFVRVGWYLSPLGIMLGIAGFALWCYRDLNQASWLFLLIALGGSFFFIRQTYGTSDQTYVYILRRYVPITYPAFSLAMAYALVALAGQIVPRSLFVRVRPAAAGILTLALLAFFIVTGRPIFRHVEYEGAVAQVAELAEQFEPGRDVLLMRGGGPTYGAARDVPDLVATPLRFVHGIDALTVKSSRPGAYADALAELVMRWRNEGREIYLLLSASGANFVLPGFALEPAGTFRFDLPEFEQLAAQKPRNVARLTLPFSVYRLVPAPPQTLAAPDLPFNAQDFGAQVHGFHLPETAENGEFFSWTSGEAVLRLAPAGALPAQIRLRLASGERPARMGPAEACFAIQAEAAPWPLQSEPPRELACLTLTEEMQTYVLELPEMASAPRGSYLLRIMSEGWVPAQADPRQTDQRNVGIQFGELRRQRAFEGSLPAQLPSTREQP
jgi:hypothetical protein